MDTDASLLELSSAESIYRVVDGVEIHAVVAGDPDDPLVVFLHGFPDFWYGWRRQIPAFVDAGYRVCVPDGRGYNLSEKPAGLEAYRVSTLAADVAGLVAAEGSESAHIVGHDWGGGIAWTLALRRPDLVDRLAVLNSPHPTVFRDALWDPRQLARSWYVFLFQLPLLPEFALGRDDATGIVRILEASSRSGAFDETDLERYRAAWRRAGAIRGALNWYRAAARRPDPPPRDRVDAPTLVIWGEDDEALRPAMAGASLDHCTDARLERVPEASHWVHLEEPDLVNDRLLDHLG